MAKTPKPFSRKGLHKLECQWCDGFAYFTVPTLEARGLPRCGWCDASERMQPATLELALEINATDAPVMQEYQAKVNSLAKGQASHYSLGRECESPEFRAMYGDPRNRRQDPGLIAETRLASDRRRRRRIPVEPMPF
jgi:hypothetical protein